MDIISRKMTGKKKDRFASCSLGKVIFSGRLWQRPFWWIATQTGHFLNVINNLDFNVGVLVEDSEMNATSEQFFEYMLRVASGEKVASEKAGFHDMAIFKQGVTL